jgi:hypothetical protein
MAKNSNFSIIQLSLLDLETKIERSTSTIEELRVPIFAPIVQVTKRSKLYIDFVKNKNVRTVETKWGKVEIRNRLLTQTHKDILDCIFTYNRGILEMRNAAGERTGRIAIYFSQTEILKNLGYSGKGSHNSWLREKLDEIRDAVLKYIDKEGNEIDFNIITKKEFSEIQNMYGIILDETYLKLFHEGLSINYEKYLPDLISLPHPVLKSAVRFFFTHKSINLKLEDLLDTLGYPSGDVGSRSMQIVIKVFKDHIDTLNEFGIIYDSKKRMFYYNQQDGIQILPRLDKKKKVPLLD